MIKNSNNKISSSLIVFITIIISVCFIFSLSGCIQLPKVDFESFWKVELPENIHLLNSAADNQSSFYGMKYDIYICDEEPCEFIADFDTQNSAEIVKEVKQLLISCSFKTAIRSYLPNWNENFCCKKLEKETENSETGTVISKCYMIYFYNSMTLLVCQDNKK